jgi:hypothetical protein
MIGYVSYVLCVWISLRVILAVCRTCSSGELAMRRARTGRTPLGVLRYRYYWFLFVIMSPVLYGLSGMMGWAIPLLSFFIAMTGLLAVLCFFMRPIGRLVNSGSSGSDYESWLRAGGHPYWDCNTWCNFDRAVVRAAIGRPPESDYCFNCGADLRGALNCGGNFGNCCNCCGAYNDIFEEPVQA